MRKLRKVKNTTAEKKRAWKEFSKYIRLRDCISTTGTKTEGICVTCGKRLPFGELQAGHALSGRNNSILLDEELVNIQCRFCNGYGGGEYGTYSVWFISKYGLDMWEEKVILQKQTAPKIDWNEKTLEYRRRYKELLDKDID
jgi:hypothetical protein